MAGGVLVILAAGEGRRFGGCKQLTPVGPGGQVVMDYTLAAGASSGFTRAVIVSAQAIVAAIRQHFVGSPIPVEVVVQPAGPRGTVPALAAVRQVFARTDPGVVSVVNGDDLYPQAAVAALAGWSGPGHAMVGFALADTMLPGTRSVSRALCRLAEGADWLVSIVEATVTPVAGGWVASTADGTGTATVNGDALVSMNAWAFDASIWDRLGRVIDRAGGEPGDRAGGEPGDRAELLLPSLVGELVAAGQERVTVLSVRGRCLGITWPEDLPRLRRLLESEPACQGEA